MRYKLFALGLMAAVCGALFLPAPARAAEVSQESSYYTLINQERYTIIHEVKVNNFGLEPAYDINLSIPLMDKETPAYSRKLREQIVPWPDRIETDERGRRMAYYHFDELDAGGEMVFTQKYVVDSASISYDDSIKNGSGGYDELMESHYLLPSPGIESDHAEIIAFAKEAAKGKTNPYDVAYNAFSAVNLYMAYEHDDLVYGGALLALRRAKGVCEDYSALYVAVLRALGIAARQQGGYLYLPAEHNTPPYWDEAKQRVNLNQMRHTWVEFYIPGQGWVVADPTFTYSFMINDVPTKFIRQEYFAKITNDRRYFFFYEGSVNEDRGEGEMNADRRSGFVETSGINSYLLSGSQAAFYNDLGGHWAETAIMRLSERDEPLLQGMGNGMFGVSEPMTRAQLVTCLQRMLKSPAAGPKFTDLRTSHWAYRDIGAAQQAGWISGYPDGSFRPDNAVTRAELAQILVNVFQLKMPQAEPESTQEQTEESGQLPEKEKEVQPVAMPAVAMPLFKDLGQPGYAWADEAIGILAALELSKGNGDGYYQPARSVTRAEFAAFLDRIISMREQ